MRQFCADDVVWRAIYEDLTTRCGLQGIGYTSAQKQRSLEKRKTRVEEQIDYKHKTPIHIFAFFEEEINGAQELISEAMNAEREASDCWGPGECLCSCHYVGDSDDDSYCACHDAKLEDFDYTFDNWARMNGMKMR